MAWVRLDDQFFLNPKIASAGRDARDLYLAGLTYSAGQLTDGFVPDGAVALVGAMAGVDDAGKPAERLVDVRLWERVDGGYEIHDYHDYNPSAERVREIRKARAEAGRKGGMASSGSNAEANTEATDKQNRTPSPSPSPSPSRDPSDVVIVSAREGQNDEEPDVLSSFIAEAVCAYENSIGLIAGETQTEEIKAFLGDLHERGHPEWWQLALDVACDNNARKWSYIRAVLRNWLEQGRTGLRTPANGARASPRKSESERIAEIEQWVADEIGGASG